MRFILLSFGLISLVNGKSILIPKEEVKYVKIQPFIFEKNQNNVDFNNKGKVSLHQPTLEFGIKPLEEKDFKKTKIVIGTTPPENNLNLHSSLQSGEANVKPYENSFIPSYEFDIKSEQNLKDSNVATDITATKNKQIYKTPNEVVLQTFEGTNPKLFSDSLGEELNVKTYESPVITFKGYVISTEPELNGADGDINTSSFQSNTGEKVINLKIPLDEIGIADLEPNKQNNNINVDLAKFQNNPYFFSRLLKESVGLEKPGFKITPEINSQNDENYLSRIFLDGNTNLQHLGDKYNDGFKYNVENDLKYKNEWKKIPFYKTFNGKHYVNIMDEDNPYITSKGWAYPQNKVKAGNVVFSHIDPQNNADLLSRVVRTQNFHDNEGESNEIKGSDLFYLREGETFPSTGSYKRRQYGNFVNRRRNPPTSSSELIYPTKQTLNANDEVIFKADSENAAYLWKYLLSRDKNLESISDNHRRSNDKESELFYTSNGRTFPLTRSMDQKYDDEINNRENYNPYYSFQPNEESSSLNNANLLPGFPNEDMIIRRISAAALGSLVDGGLS